MSSIGAAARRAAVLAALCLSAGGALGQELPLPFDGALGRTYRAELEFLLIPPEALPPGCSLLREFRTAPIYPATTNPFATEDARLIAFAARLTVGPDADLARVRAAVSAVYQDRKPSFEIGIMGLRYLDEAAASDALRRAVAARPHDQARLLLKGPMVLVVWRDDGVRDTSYEAVRSFLARRVFPSAAADP